ncbi:hypothetical protein AAG570_012949 [Ranatra chinensis]|uniref:SGTA homodimerisation domain-containing protein n=1 Tax=Ranatra chinensis TaxID=642074 RepID=A0ABD0YFB7_9HEMI
MDDNKRQLIGSILAFLKNELTAPYLSAEDLEGLEVAIQCLESTYNVPTSSAAEPPLEEIYKTFLATSVKNRPDASDDAKKEAERLKVEGNIAMTAQSYNEALELYTSAISYDSKNAVYYCNRAAAYSKLFDHKSAINDCKMAIELDPKYSKAYGRLGLAYTGLDDYQKALENYRIAAQLDPDNDGYRNNVLLAERKINETEQSSNGPNFDFNMVFGNPQLLSIATQMLSDPTMQNM